MVTVFPNSANQPNEIALNTICNCFRLMRDWKLENLANGKEISTVPFDGKGRSLLWFVYFPVSRQSWTWPQVITWEGGVVIDRVKSH